MVKVKRQRLSIKRISSRTELPVVNNAYAATEPTGAEVAMTVETKKTMEGELEWRASNASPEPKVAAGILAPAHFLRACSFCQLSLGPGRDTFIYRGEFAFCSKECRQQLIAKEEHRHKFERWLQTLLESYSPLAVQASGFELDLHT